MKSITIFIYVFKTPAIGIMKCGFVLAFDATHNNSRGYYSNNAGSKFIRLVLGIVKAERHVVLLT